jgi:hypothetical protein
MTWNELLLFINTLTPEERGLTVTVSPDPARSNAQWVPALIVSKAVPGLPDGLGWPALLVYQPGA